VPSAYIHHPSTHQTLRKSSHPSVMATSTTSRPSNVAAWALKPKSRPLVVAQAPYRDPPRGHVVVKVCCVAINPIDWIMQDTDIFGARYPAIFGSDLAGKIVEVGEGVAGLRVGEKVIA
jgi:NADPH:quinone reductase-like Zn-dependent oxidoreductase